MYDHYFAGFVVLGRKFRVAISIDDRLKSDDCFVYDRVVLDFEKVCELVYNLSYDCAIRVLRST